jgi:hypothetical protein
LTAGGPRPNAAEHGQKCLVAMTSTPRPPLSLAFDDLLAQGKKGLDDLYNGGQPGKRGARARLFDNREIAAREPSVASIEPGADSPAARLLDERFGHHWHFQITEQTRDGDDVIVLGKLTFGKDNALRTQRGRARISPSPVAGTSSGMRFEVGGFVTEQDERNAFCRAAEDALTNCINLI